MVSTLRVTKIFHLCAMDFPFSIASVTHIFQVGYAGAMRLLEKILGVLMDKQDREAPEESFELVM